MNRKHLRLTTGKFVTIKADPESDRLKLMNWDDSGIYRLIKVALINGSGDVRIPW